MPTRLALVTMRLAHEVVCALPGLGRRLEDVSPSIARFLSEPTPEMRSPVPRAEALLLRGDVGPDPASSEGSEPATSPVSRPLSPRRGRAWTGSSCGDIRRAVAVKIETVRRPASMSMSVSILGQSGEPILRWEIWSRRAPFGGRREGLDHGFEDIVLLVAHVGRVACN